MNTTENEPQESSCPELRSSGAVSVPATTNSALGASFVGGNMKLSDALRGLGRPVAIYPGLCKVLGGVNATLFLCQMAYWTGKQRDEDGWIYKTMEEIEEETGLTKEEQRTARKRLRTINVIEEREARLEHKLFYHINFDRLNEIWETQISGNAESRSPEVGNPDFGKSGMPTPYIEQRLHTETTPEITKNIYAEIILDLNAKAGTIFKPTNRATIEMIRARMAEDHTVNDFKKVHAKKCAEWKGTDMAKYLRPETLYRPSHFESYLNQPDPTEPRADGGIKMSVPLSPAPTDPLDITDIYTCKSCHRKLRMTKRLYKGSTLERYRQCSECFETTKGV